MADPAWTMYRKKEWTDKTCSERVEMKNKALRKFNMGKSGFERASKLSVRQTLAILAE